MASVARALCPVNPDHTLVMKLPQESHQISQPPCSISCPNVNLPRLPNSESISNRLMVTEIATLKADLNSTKADLRECLLRLDSSTYHVHSLAQQIASIKEEVSLLHRKMDMMSSSTQPDSPVLSSIPPQLPLPNISQFTVTTFNC